MTPLIQKTPDVLGGDARIRNTRIAVWMLVENKRWGLMDEEIRCRYEPPLTAADLAAAWRYYDRNREEIEMAIRLNDEA